MTTIAFLFLIEFPGGGTGRICQDIVKTLHNRGNHVILYCDNLPEHPLPEGLKCVQMPRIAGQKGRVRDKEMLPKLIASFKEQQVDICFMPHFYYRYTKELRAATGCKIVFSLHSQPFWEIVSKMSLQKARAWENPWRMMKWMFHDIWRFYILKSYQKKQHRRYLQRLQETDAFTVLCEGYRQELLVHFASYDEAEKKLFVLHNGSEPTLSTLPQKKKRIVFVGRLEYPDKRPDRMLKIWEKVHVQLPDWELHFIGDGNYGHRLKATAKSLQLPRVYFTGYQEDVATPMSEASILCLTSSIEGWGLVIGEAQMLGTVPLAFDVSAGVREQMLPQWENGVLIPPFDMDTYADALVKLAQDEELRQQMSLNVRQQAKRFSLEAAAEEYEVLIKQLVHDYSPPQS